MSRIEHFAVFAAELEKLRDFYIQWFGLRVIVDNGKAPTRGYFLADEAGVSIELIERPAGEPGANTRYVCHTAFLVDDYDGFRTKLGEAGISIEKGTEVDNAEMRTCFFNDPEGNRCQIVWRARPLGT